MISVPYTVYAAITPDAIYGDRFVEVKSREKIAKRITEDLKNAGLVITESSVATTPTIGQYQARVTIIGFDNIDSPNLFVGGKITVDAPYTSTNDNYDGTPGRTVKGYVGVQDRKQNQQINPQLKNYVRILKNKLETASPDYLKPGGVSAIYRIDYMGFIFGKDGYSF